MTLLLELNGSEQVTAKTGTDTGSFSASESASVVPLALPPRVQTVSNASTVVATSIAATFGSAVSSGNRIIVWGTASGDGTGFTITDTQTNTYTTGKLYDATNDQTIFWGYTTTASATAATVTLGFGSSVPYRGIIVSEYRSTGTFLAGPLTNNTTNTTAANSVTSATSATLASSPSVVIGFAMDDANVSQTVTAGTGYTLYQSPLNGVMFAAEDRQYASTTGVAATFTYGTAGRYIAAALVFADTSSATTPITASDGGTLSATDTSANTSTLSVTDTGTLSATDTSANASTLSRTDTGTLSAADLADNGQAQPKVASDTGTLSATDTSSLFQTIAISVSDTGTFSATDTSASASTFSRTDTGTLSATDTSSVPAAGAKFITTVDASGRYFNDQNGNPILVKADSPWLAFQNVSTSEWNTLCSTRASQGFNALLVDLVGWNASDTGIAGVPNTGTGGATYDAIVPFTGGNLATPNAAYWSRIDTFVATAASYGITLFIYGIDYYQIHTSGEVYYGKTVSDFTTLGTFIGNRYKNATNIVWMFGNDYSSSDGFDPHMNAMLAAIKATGDTHLYSATLDFHLSYSYDSTNWASSDFWSVYSYPVQYSSVKNGYDHSPVKPSVMVEAAYIGESYTGGHVPLSMRKQAAWTLTSGGAGNFIGTEDWVFKSGWASRLIRSELTGISVIHATVENVQWWKLVPSTTFVTSGAGTRLTATNTGPYVSSTNPANWPEASNYASASVANDGSLALVYLPDQRAIQVNTALLGTSPSGTWVNAQTGAETATGSLASSITPPSSGDWLLRITATPVAVTPKSASDSGTISATDVSGVAPPAGDIYDDANRADSTLTADSRWLPVYGTIRVVGNQFATLTRGGGGWDSAAKVSVATPDDVSVSIDVTARGNIVDNWPGVFARYIDGNNLYLVQCSFGTGTDTVFLYRRVAGTWTLMDSVNMSLGSSFNLRLDTIGSNIRGYVNGSQVVSAVDTNFSSGSVGMWFVSNPTVQPVPTDNTTRMDNFTYTSSSVTINKSGSDTGTFSATETAALAPSLPLTDSGILSAIEVASLATFSANTDTGTLSVTDTSSNASALARVDTGTFSVTESVALSVTLSANDTGTISATDTSNVVAPFTAISVSDTGTFSITDTSASAGALARTDTGTFSATETSAPLVMVSVTDTGTLSVTEAVTLANTMAVTDTGTLSATESIATLMGFAASDTGTFSITDTSAGSGTGALTDVGTFSATDVSTVLNTLGAVSDTGTLSATESSSVAVFGTVGVNVSDTGTISATDTSSMQQSLSVNVSDTGTFSATEARAIASTSALTDSGTLMAIEVATIAAASTLTDTGTLSAADGASVFNDRPGADTGTLSATDISSVTVTGTVAKDVSDAGTLSATDSVTQRAAYISATDTGTLSAADGSTNFSRLGGALDATLLAEYVFNETSGSATVDTSGNGNTAILVGDAALGSGVLTLPGTRAPGSFASVPRTTALEPVSNITVMAWYQTSAHGGSRYLAAVAKGRAGAGDSYALYTHCGNNDEPAFVISTTAGTSIVQVGQTISDEGWHHFAATYDGSTVRTYIDGVARNTASVTGNIVYETTALTLGGSATFPDESMYGSVDEVRLFNRVLTGAEIASTMAVRGTYQTVIADGGIISATDTGFLGASRSSTDAGTISATEAASLFTYSGTGVKVWNGTEFVAGTFKIWDGEEFLTPPIRIWNGTAMVTIS
jgi:hypothetical protein